MDDSKYLRKICSNTLNSTLESIIKKYQKKEIKIEHKKNAPSYLEYFEKYIDAISKIEY